MTVPILELHNITKLFPGVRALSDVCLDFHPGEIHALVGENGAGKSTLLGVASGRLKPDEGEMLLRGQPLTLSGPQEGRRRGIAVIHQEAELFPDLSVAEWIALLGSGLPSRGGLIRWGEAQRNAAEATGAVGSPLPGSRLSADLTAAERQVTEIAAAHGQKLTALFLDEPTTSLTQREIESLYKLLADLKKQGVGIVYVSHRLSEVFDLSDRITVLRDGEVAARLVTAETNEDEVVTAMVGRQVEQFFPKTERPPGEVVFVSKGLSDRPCDGIDIELRAGEVVGMYGLIGSGRTEWAQTVLGVRPVAQGSLEVLGCERSDTAQEHLKDPSDALEMGVVYLPEDRHVMGLFQDLSVESNTSIATLRARCTGPFVRKNEVRSAVLEGLRRLGTRMVGIDVPVSTLSGGNQQKVVLARWLLAEPRILLLDEPTRGIDVGAKAEVHRLVDELAGQGLAVVLISSELPEVMGMSDRILVVRDGTVAAEFQRGEWTEDSIAAAALPPIREEASLDSPKTAHIRRQQVEQASYSSRVNRAESRAKELLYVAARREVLLAVALTVLGGWLTLACPGRFLTWNNLSDTLLNITPVTIAAVGMTYVIVAGGIDISVGSLLAICASVVGLTSKQTDGVLLPLLAGLGVGLLGGALNGALAIVGRLHPILVTLGTMSLFRGLVILVTGGVWIQDLPPSFVWLGQEGYGLPYPVWIMLGVALVAMVIGGWTKMGRLVYAVGSNPHAAQTIGLPLKRTQFATFAALGMLVGLAAVVQDAQYGQVQTNTGIGFELAVIAAVVVGGTNIMGGSGTVIGTLLASILLGLTGNAMVLLNVSTYYDKVVVGILILAAVVGDGLIRRRHGGAG